MDKVYIVTKCVDVHNTVSSTALAAFKDAEDAEAYVRNDMEDACDARGDAPYQVDFDEMTLVDEDEDVMIVWKVTELEVK